MGLGVDRCIITLYTAILSDAFFLPCMIVLHIAIRLYFCFTALKCRVIYNKGNFVLKLSGQNNPHKVNDSCNCIILSHNFWANLTKLYRPFGRLKQCVIRWFSFTSVNAYQGFQVVFFANRHLMYTE